MPPKTYKGKQPVTSSSRFNSERFKDAECAKRFESIFKDRTVIFEKIVVQSELQNTDFLRWLHSYRLMVLMNLSHPCFEDWVREFYCNIFDVTGGSFKTFVRGKTLSVDANKIATLLDLERPAPRSYPYYDPDAIITQINEVATVLCGEPTVWNGSYLETSLLTTDYRLLNIFVCYNIEPRSHTSNLLYSQAFLLYSLGTGTSVDIPLTIVHSMVRVYAEQRELTLPFGAIICKLMVEAGCQAYNAEIPIVKRQKINGKTRALSDTRVNRIRKRGAETDSIQHRLQAVEHAVFDQSIQIEQLDERVAAGFSDIRNQLTEHIDQRVAAGFSDISNQLTEMFNQLRHQ